MNAFLASVPSTSPGLAPDPDLPQRDLLLDDQQMAARLSWLVGAGQIDGWEKQRIKYRIGESLRVLYRLCVNGRVHLIATKAFAESYAPGVGRFSEHRSAQFYDANIRAAFWTFPNDRKIKHLSLLHAQPQTLSSVLAGNWHKSECVAYVPEKCATVRCLDREGQIIAYAKMYAAEEVQSLRQTYLQLASACRHVVKPLEYSEPHQLLLLEAVAGCRICDLTDKNLGDGFAGLAQALASLHSVPILPQLPRFRRHDPERLRKCARIIGSARRDVASVVNDLNDQLHSNFPAEEPLVCLHGDVHPKNGIALNGLVTLIDLDQCGAGPAAADLGSMLALLHYNWRIGLITRRKERELASAFLDAYRSSRQLPAQSSLNWHTAAALLSERALRSVNRIRPEGLYRLAQLLNDAREILGTGGVRS